MGAVRWLTLTLAMCLAAQTMVHAPSQVRGLAGGGAVAWHAAPLSFGGLAAGACAERAIPADGMSAGLTIAAGWPAELPQGVHGLMYAGSGVVVVRLCAAQAASIPPLTFSAAAIVWR